MKSHLHFEIIKDLRKSFSRKFCLAPGAMRMSCSGTIVAAHSVQRNGCGLCMIAESGHVLSFAPDSATGQPRMTMIGIRRASTFTGFCRYHDAAIFAPIETRPFSFEPSQVFLHLYRALCRELFHKESSHEFTDTLAARNLPGQRIVQSFGAGTHRGLAELRVLKHELDVMLMNSDYSRLRYLVCETSQTPSILVSSWISIDRGFQGQIIQRLDDRSNLLHGTMLSIIPRRDAGYVIFAWLDDRPAATRFIRSLDRVADTELAESLLHFAFEFSDNVYCRPSWWNSLPRDAQDSLERHYWSGARVQRRASWLILRPRIALDWTVIKNHTVLTGS